MNTLNHSPDPHVKNRIEDIAEAYQDVTHVPRREEDLLFSAVIDATNRGVSKGIRSSGDILDPAVDAEDIAQSALLKIVSQLATGGYERGNLCGYSFVSGLRMVHNERRQAIKRFSGDMRQVSSALSVVQDTNEETIVDAYISTDISPEDTVVTRDGLAFLLDAIPEHFRTETALVSAIGMNRVEAAEVLNGYVKPATITSRSQRGRAEAREALEEQGYNFANLLFGKPLTKEQDPVG